MRRIVDFGQMLEIEMRVDLRRGNTGVAEHFLHRAQIAGGLQDMRGKRVTQHVRMNMAWQAELQGKLRQAQLNHPMTDPPTAPANEKCRLFRPGKRLT